MIIRLEGPRRLGWVSDAQSTMGQVFFEVIIASRPLEIKRRSKDCFYSHKHGSIMGCAPVGP